MAARTEYVELDGVCKWVRHNKPDEDGNWTHVLYPDAPSVDKVRELQAQGVKNVLKKDEDGYHIRWKRPMQKDFGKGEVKGFNPPEVKDERGNDLSNVLIGNGSTVTTQLEVYQHKTPTGGTAKAARWMAMKVHDLVPYEGRRTFNENTPKDMSDRPAPSLQQ